jgi:hypothetical protein
MYMCGSAYEFVHYMKYEDVCGGIGMGAPAYIVHVYIVHKAVHSVSALPLQSSIKHDNDNIIWNVMTQLTR